MKDLQTALQWWSFATEDDYFLLQLRDDSHRLHTGCSDKIFRINDYTEGTFIDIPGYLISEVLWEVWKKAINELAARHQPFDPEITQ